MVVCTTIFLSTAYYRPSTLRIFTTPFRSASSSSSVKTMSTPSALAAFLRENKKKFLADVKVDGAKEWTVVMGNEAGGEHASSS